MIYLIGTMAAIVFMVLGAVGYDLCLRALISEHRLIITIYHDTVGEKEKSRVAFDIISREEAAAKLKEKESN